MPPGWPIWLRSSRRSRLATMPSGTEIELEADSLRAKYAELARKYAVLVERLDPRGPAEPRGLRCRQGHQRARPPRSRPDPDARAALAARAPARPRRAGCIHRARSGEHAAGSELPAGDAAAELDLGPQAGGGHRCGRA